MAKAIDDDIFPHESIAGLFGLASGDGHEVFVRASSSDTMQAFGSVAEPEYMPLSTVVFGSWITLQSNGLFRPKEIVDALLRGRLVAWYLSRVRNDGAPLSYYSLALIEGEWLERIEWDYATQAKLVADAQPDTTPDADAVDQKLDATADKSHLADLHALISLIEPEVQAADAEVVVRVAQSTFEKIEPQLKQDAVYVER